MKYQKTVDIGNMSDKDIRALQPGQWVYTTQDRPVWRGRFWGVKPSGTIVVAWQGNAHRAGGWHSYQRSLRAYAQAKGA